MPEISKSEIFINKSGAFSSIMWRVGKDNEFLLFLSMKRIVTILFIGLGLLMAGAATSCANAGNAPKSEIKKLIKEFDRKKGVESVNLGSFAMSLFRKAATVDASDDDETMTAVRAMDKISGLTIVDMEDSSRAVRDEFHRKFTALMGEGSLLMSVKDEGEDILFYGTSSPDGKTVDDLIIYMPSELSLMCLWGSISTEALAGLADSIKE